LPGTEKAIEPVKGNFGSTTVPVIVEVPAGYFFRAASPP
jgi:hypothetical protein